MSKYIKTSEVIAVENYPYGFKLRTTLTDSMEFNAKKGYRHVTQTVNPNQNICKETVKRCLNDRDFLARFVNY